MNRALVAALCAIAGLSSWATNVDSWDICEGAGTQSGNALTATALAYRELSENDDDNCDTTGYYVGIHLDWTGGAQKSSSTYASFSDNAGRTVELFQVHKALGIDLSPDGSCIRNTHTLKWGVNYLASSYCRAFVTPQSLYELCKQGKDYVGTFTIGDNVYTLTIPRTIVIKSGATTVYPIVAEVGADIYGEIDPAMATAIQNGSELKLVANVSTTTTYEVPEDSTFVMRTNGKQYTGNLKLRGGAYDFKPGKSQLVAGYEWADAGGGLYRVQPTHAHQFAYEADGNVISMRCTVKGVDCDYNVNVRTAALVAVDTPYTGAAYAGASVVTNEGFVGDIEISYRQGEIAIDGLPVDAGDYTAVMTVGSAVATKAFTIERVKMEDVAASLASAEFDYTAKQIENALTGVTFGDCTLGAGDYELSGTLTAVGSGYSNETYAVTLTGKGNFDGTKTLTWTIKAPTGAFASSAPSEGVGGIYEGTTLTLTNGTDYVFEDGKWKAGIDVSFPVAAFAFTRTDKAVFTRDGAMFTAADDTTAYGVACDTAKVVCDYVRGFTFSHAFTAQELEAAAGADITNMLTACALVWKDGLYGDADGVRATDFAIVANTADITLPLTGEVTYDLGDTRLENIRILLGSDAKVTSTVQQDEGRIFTDIAGYVVKATFDEGVYTYAVVEHDHVWQWVKSKNGSGLTASCAVTVCAYHAQPIAMSIAPTAEAEKYCDQKPLTATVTGGDKLAEITGATVGDIAYATTGGEALAGAPVQPGSYVATCTVISADGTATNAISTTLEILTGEVIVDGVHYGDAAAILEQTTTNDLSILVGKDFTASKTYVVPASWKAESLAEVDMTIRQFVTAVKNGEFGDLYSWADVLDLIAGRVTAQELFQRLKDKSQTYTLLDCGGKTLDLNGFTVTTAAGGAFVRNLGTLTLKGEGTLVTNACEYLLVNEGTMAIEGGTYLGSITNAGTLVVSGGYFNGTIANGGGTVVLTGGTYEIKPDEDFIPTGYDLVRRDGIYHVEKHVHAYTFLPLGRCNLSCTCWNWFVDDPDEVIQLSNCGAHKVGVFIGTKDRNIGMLPQMTYLYTGKPVEAGIVGYNYSAILNIGMLKNVQELVDIAKDAIEAEENWDEMTRLEQIEKMLGLIASVEDLNIDLDALVWNREKITEETGLAFGEIAYFDLESGEALEGAPSAVGAYKATVTITTPKGNEVVRSWCFFIIDGTEYADDAEQWFAEAELMIKDDWRTFVENVSNAWNRLPTEEEIRDYFEELDRKCREWFNELVEKYGKKTPSVPESEGTYVVDSESQTVTVTPENGTNAVDVINAGDYTVILPPSVDFVSGVETNKIVIMADATNETDEVRVDITDAFTIEKVSDGSVVIELNSNAVVNVEIEGKEPENIAVAPELGTAAGTQVAESPFVVTEDAIATGVKTIPGLTYDLLSGDTVTGITNVVKTVVAEDTRIVLEAAKGADPAKFYKVQVSK